MERHAKSTICKTKSPQKKRGGGKLARIDAKRKITELKERKKDYKDGKKTGCRDEKSRVGKYA